MFDPLWFGYGSSYFRVHIHIPKPIADLLPDGFIWIPFCQDMDQTIFETRDTIPRLWQICFQKALFGHLFVKIWIKSFQSLHTHPRNHIRFCTRWHHSDTLLSRSGSSHFRARRANPKAHVLFVQNGKECVYFVIATL